MAVEKMLEDLKKEKDLKDVKMKKKKLVKRSESKKRQKEMEKKKDHKSKIEENEDPKDVQVVNVKKPINKFDDMPKKLDDVLGPIRAEPIEIPKEPEPVAVYYETGNYSVSGVGENVKLKPMELARKNLEQRQKVQDERKRMKKREPKYALPEKPAKFPKAKLRKPEPSPLDEEAKSKENKEQKIEPEVAQLIQLEDNKVEDDKDQNSVPQIEDKEVKEPKPETVERPKIIEQKSIEDKVEESLKPISKEERIESWLEETLIQTQENEEIDFVKEMDPVQAQPFVPLPEETRPYIPPASPPIEDSKVTKVKPVKPIQAKIGINGFEKSARLILREALKSGFNIVAINEPFTPPEFMVYALKYDWGDDRIRVSSTGGQLIVNGKSIHVFAERDASKIPWETVGVQYVIETVEPLASVGEAKRHLRAKEVKVSTANLLFCNFCGGLKVLKIPNVTQNFIMNI